MPPPAVAGFTGWRPLARGGLAVVWEARQQSLDRPVAVKHYLRRPDHDADRRRFLRETTAVGRLCDHPGVVTAYDAGTDRLGRPYLVMELRSGGSLTSWLDPRHRPDEERIRRVGLQIADALAVAHARGVLHGDVKPGNILLDAFGDPALADFGLARVTDLPEVSATVADELAVTPAYAPPEAFELQPATAAADVFSLAATVYALLTGRPPRSEGAAAVTLEQMRAAAQRPIAPVPGVNWYLMEALSAALADDPEARPSASELRDQLAEAAGPRLRARVHPSERRTVSVARRAAGPTTPSGPETSSQAPRRSASAGPAVRAAGGRRALAWLRPPSPPDQ